MSSRSGSGRSTDAASSRARRRALAAQVSGGFGAGEAFAARRGEGKLFYYNWAQYVNPKTYPAFTKATGIKVKKDFYDSNEALLAKLQGRGAGLRPRVPDGLHGADPLAEKLLEPIDWSKLAERHEERRPEVPQAAVRPQETPARWRRTGARPDSCTGPTRSRSGRRPGDSSSTWPREVLGQGDRDGSTASPSASARCSRCSATRTTRDDQSELDAAKKELVALKPHLLSITSIEVQAAAHPNGKAVDGRSAGTGTALARGVEGPVNGTSSARRAASSRSTPTMIPVGAENPDAAARLDRLRLRAEDQRRSRRTYTYYGSPLQAGAAEGDGRPGSPRRQGRLPAERARSKKLEPNSVTAKGTRLREPDLDGVQERVDGHWLRRA